MRVDTFISELKYGRFDSFILVKFDSHDADDEPGTTTTDRSGFKRAAAVQETEAGSETVAALGS